MYNAFYIADIVSKNTTKHSKPNNTNDKGGIFDIEAPIHVSNVKKIEEKATKKETAKEEKTTKKTTTKKASK